MGRFRKTIVSLMVCVLCGPSIASTVDRSERPAPRPEEPRLASAAAVFSSVRPIPRNADRALPSTRESTTTPTTVGANPAAFNRWVADFKRRARASGIRADVLDAAFARAEYLPRVVELDRNQNEFTKTLWDYLSTAVSATRVRNGKAALSRHSRVLERIERTYGVKKEIVVAVWGLETSYGGYMGGTSVISSLATLAFDGRRGAYFEGELINALKILQSGDTRPQNMEGSWAGAMGHTQFMPSSFLNYAVDFTGDGRRDIWGANPADALASTANYLRAFGWKTGQPWGMEVQLPQGFDYRLTGERTKKSAAEWNRLGVRQMNGQRVPNHGPASILVPGGAGHAAFVIYANFQVIEKYNPADAYVIGIGHLADRIAGGPAISGSWPHGDRALSGDERRELQRRLRRAGFDPGKVDGKIGPETLAAVRGYQASLGVTVDGYVSLALLNQLRRR